MIPIKTSRQIDKMRLACETASELLGRAALLVAPGVTTGEVDATVGEWIKEAGCRSAFLGYRGFPGHICISINEEVVHGIGGPRRIQYGDIVKLDIGVVRDGWVGDNAITVPVGAVDARTSALLEATEASLAAGIAEVAAGRHLGDCCAAIEEEILKRGFSVVREFVGHGVGKRLHEEPQIPNYGRRGSGPKLKEGMTLAIEPMVNSGVPGVKILDDGWTVITKDRQPSAHFEHTILVCKGGAEILTPRHTVLKSPSAAGES